MNFHLYCWAVVTDETFYINEENWNHNIDVYNGRHSESLDERLMLNKLNRIKPHKGKTWEDILLSLIYSSMSSAFKHKTNSSNKRGRSHSRPCVISGWTCRLKYLQRQENKMRKTSTQCMSAYSLKCTASQAAGRIQGYIHNAHSILPHEYLKKYSFLTRMTLFLLQNKQEDIEFDFLCPQNKGQWGPKQYWIP